MEPTGEIFFRCTACRRRLAVESRAVGQLVDCPNCHASLMVPDHSTTTDPAIVRRRAAIAFVLLGFLGCGFAGWLLAGSPIAQKTSAALGLVGHESAPLAPVARRGLAEMESAEAGTASAAGIQREYENLQHANRAISRQYEDLANWVLTNLRGRFLLKKQHVARLRFPPVNDDFTVNPELADFLTVNEGESTLINDVFQYSRSMLSGLQQSYLTATQDAPARVTLYIPPFEREGAVLREDLYGALQTVLGADRFNRLMEVSEQDLAKAYDYFGAASRTMVFEVAANEDSSKSPYLVIKDGWVIPQDESKRTTETTEEAVNELPSRYKSYLAWLPDFVSAYAKP